MTVDEAARQAQDGRNEGLRMAVLDCLTANAIYNFLSAPPREQETTILTVLKTWTPEQRGLYFKETLS